EVVPDVRHMLTPGRGLDVDGAELRAEDEVEADRADRPQTGGDSVAQLRLPQGEADQERDRDAGVLGSGEQRVPDEGQSVRVHPHAADNAGMGVEEPARLAIARGDAQEDRLVPLADVPTLADVGRAAERAATGGGEGGAGAAEIDIAVE